MVESSSDDILKDADKVDVAFLVVGDPFGYERPIHTYSVVILTSATEQQHIPTSSSVLANSPSPCDPFPTLAS
jgi:diphthamide biosynthesis methyltransferase